MMEKFQIAVATLPKSRLEVHLDIDIIKVALMYGDEVKLYSLSAEFSTYTQIISGMNNDQFGDFMLEVLRKL